MTHLEFGRQAFSFQELLPSCPGLCVFCVAVKVQPRPQPNGRRPFHFALQESPAEAGRIVSFDEITMMMIIMNYDYCNKRY